MDKIIFTIPYPATAADKKRWSQEYGLNAYYAGKHWAKRKRDAEFWHMLTRHAVQEAGIKHTRKPFKKPVVIKFYWNDRLDIDNHAAMGKMIVDGLKGNLLIDDDRKHLASVQHFWHNENYIKVEIEEFSDEKQQKRTKAG